VLFRSKGNYPQVILNKDGELGGAPSGHSYAAVNGFLTAFGTKKYAVLSHGNHERDFDHGKLLESNAKSSFDHLANGWKRYDWNDERFVNSTPWGAELGGWLSKHLEINAMIYAFLGKQAYYLTFFEQAGYDRWLLNVQNNLNKTVAEVNIQLSTQAEISETNRQIKRDGSKVEGLVTKGITVDGFSFDNASTVVKVRFQTSYSKNPVIRDIDPTNAADMKYLAGALNSDIKVSLVK
jgi:hypothetical protein